MKTYSKEFKEESLKLYDKIGVKNAAAQLGLAYYTLADWRNRRKNAHPQKVLSKMEQDASSLISNVRTKREKSK